MQKYFEKFPIITYKNYTVVNIMSRVKILEKIYNRPDYFNPIEIINDTRPDSVANKFYGDPYMSWLVYLSNGIVDPYYDWKLSQYEFDNYIKTKYTSVANAQGRIAYWTNNWYTDPGILSVSEYDSLIDRHKQYYEAVYIGNTILEYKRKEEDWKINTNQIWEYTVSGNTVFTEDEKILITSSSGDIVANGQVFFSNSSIVKAHHVFGSGAGDIESINVSSINTPVSDTIGHYTVTFNVANGSYSSSDNYQVVNNENDSYNGIYKAVSSNSSSVTLLYNSDPGTSSGSITKIIHLPSVGYIRYYTGSPYPLMSGSENVSSTITSAKLLAKNISDVEAVFWAPISYYEIEDIKNHNNQNIILLSNNHAMQAAIELKRLLKS